MALTMLIFDVSLSEFFEGGIPGASMKILLVLHLSTGHCSDCLSVRSVDMLLQAQQDERRIWHPPCSCCCVGARRW